MPGSLAGQCCRQQTGADIGQQPNHRQGRQCDLVNSPATLARGHQLDRVQWRHRRPPAQPPPTTDPHQVQQLDGKPGHQRDRVQLRHRRPPARPRAAVRPPARPAVPPGEHHQPRWRKATSSTRCRSATAGQASSAAWCCSSATTDHRSAPGAAARRQAGPPARPGAAVRPGDAHQPRWRKVTSSTACRSATADHASSAAWCCSSATADHRSAPGATARRQAGPPARPGAAARPPARPAVPPGEDRRPR